MEFSPATMNMLCGVIETTWGAIISFAFFVQFSYTVYTTDVFSRFPSPCSHGRTSQISVCVCWGTCGHFPLKATKVWTVVLTFLPVVPGQCWKMYQRFSMARINHLKMQSRSFLLWDVWFSLKSNSVIPLSQWPIGCTLGLVKALIQNPWYT